MRLTISDVVAHRVVEQHGFLRDDADLRAQRGKGHIADIVTVDLQTTGSQIEEARNKVDESALPGATGAYDGEHLTPLHFKIDGAEDVAGALLVTVREACAFENDALGERRQRLGSRLLADIIFTLGKLEDLRRCTDGLLEAVVEERELSNGLVQLEDQRDEGKIGTRGESTVADLVASEQEQKGDGDCAESIHQRRTDGGGRHRTQVSAQETLCGSAKAGYLPRFHAECFHNAIARNGFVQDILDFGQLVLSAAGGVADAAANLGGGKQNRGKKKNQHPSKFAAQQDHGGNRENQGEHLLEEFSQHA